MMMPTHEELTVKLANESCLMTSTKAIATISFPNYVKRRLDFFVLDIEIEPILGMPFLARCNPVIDWTDGTVSLDNHVITVQSTSPDVVSARCFSKEIRTGQYNFIGSLCQVAKPSTAELHFTHRAAHGSGAAIDGSGDIQVSTDQARKILSEL